MIESRFKLPYTTRIKARKSSIFFKKFPVFLGANSNVRKVETGFFFIKKKLSYLALVDNLQSRKLNNNYAQKNYKLNTPPPDKKNWGGYLSKKKFLNIKKFLKKDQKILEIGAGNSFFAKKIIKKFPTIHYTIIDPLIKKKKLQKNITIISKHYPSKINLDNSKYDLIIIFSCLEHMKNPSRAIKYLSKNLKNKGKLLVEVPDITKQINKADFNMFTFEHYNYFNLHSLSLMFKKENLEIISHKKFNDTLFCVLKKKIKNQKKSIVINTQKLKFDFRKYKTKLIMLKKLFDNLFKKNVNFGIHGANFGAFNILFLLNLAQDKRVKIFDNDNGKVGKYFGSKFIKVKKAYSKEYKKLDVLLISALSYVKEIKNSLKLKNINFKCIKTL